MNTKAFFPCGGGSNLILGIGRENQISFLKTPAAVKFLAHLVYQPKGLVQSRIVHHVSSCVIGVGVGICEHLPLALG